MPRPLISVVIPTWNRARYIGETLHSVFKQTVQDVEILVVDDGSTDDTPRVIALWKDKITYIRQTNQGPSVARNAGIAAARGEIVAFVDSDDTWEPNHLETALAAFEKYPEARLVATNYRIVDGNGRTILVTGKQSPGAYFTTWSLLNNDWRTVGTPAVDRKALLEVGGFDPRFIGPEDMNMWLRFSLKYPMAHAPFVTQNYRCHGANLGSDAARFYRAEMEAIKIFLWNYPHVVLEAHNSAAGRRSAWMWRVLSRLPLPEEVKKTCWLLGVRPGCLKSIRMNFHYTNLLHAYTCLVEGRPREARAHIAWRHAWRHRPVKQMLYWLFSFLPPAAYAAARNAKWRILGRITGKMR